MVLEKNIAFPIKPFLQCFNTSVPLSAKQVPDFTVYADQVLGFHAIVLSEVQRFLSRFFSDHYPDLDIEKSGIAFATTGSDGRKEKSPNSKVELQVVFSSSQGAVVDMAALKSKLETAINTRKDLFVPGIDLIDLAKDNVLLYQNKHNLVFPTRVFDSVFIGGSKSVFLDFKKASVDKMQWLFQKKHIKPFNEQFGMACQVLKSEGVQNYRGSDVIHYKMDESGVHLFYSPEGVRQGSAKYGHLRSVQYFVALKMCTLFSQAPSRFALESMPTNIPERLHFLRLNGVLRLGEKECDQIGAAYKAAVRFYHLSEEAYVLSGSKEVILTGKDAEIFKQSTKVIVSFVSSKTEREE